MKINQWYRKLLREERMLGRKGLEARLQVLTLIYRVNPKVRG